MLTNVLVYIKKYLQIWFDLSYFSFTCNSFSKKEKKKVLHVTEILLDFGPLACKVVLTSLLIIMLLPHFDFQSYSEFILQF